MTRITQHDEYLLSRLVDGDLPGDEAESLRGRMEREPDLRAAFQSLVRLDAALKARRADQPRVDWRQMHRRVMSAVERETIEQPALIKLSRWLAFGLPLAAAAAVALVVTMNRRPAGDAAAPTDRLVSAPSLSPESRRENLPPIQVAYNVGESARRSGVLTVDYHRSAVAAPAPSIAMTVVYGRSAELERELRETDAQERSRRPWIVAAINRPAMIPNELAELPPL